MSFGCLPQSLLMLDELNLVGHFSYTGWPVSSQDLPVCPSSSRVTVLMCPAFYNMGAGNINSGPQACVASTTL